MSRNIKKTAISLAVLGIAFGRPTGASAAFNSITKFARTAQAVLIGAGSVSLTAPVIKKVSDNSTVTQVDWTGLALPAGWVRADDYLQLDSVVTAANGGIQIYTDNMNVAASPKFTGNNANTDPSGLLDTTNPSLRLPVAWSHKAGPALPVAPPPAAEPNDFLTNPNSAQWVYMADRGTLASVGGGAVTFADGSTNVELLDGSLGIHAASGGGPQGNGFFVGSFPRTYLYLSSNFGAATTPRTYQTSEMILEAFTQ